MQKLIVILSAVLLTAMAASVDARGRGGQGGFGAKGYNGGGADRQVQFQQKLNLSDEQVAQMRDIRQNGGTREEIHAVLNEAQRAMVNEHRGEMNGRGGRSGHGGNGRQGRGNPLLKNEQAPTEGGKEG